MDISAITDTKKHIDQTIIEHLTQKQAESINERQRDLITRLIPFVTSGKSIRGCLAVFVYSLFSTNRKSEIFDCAAALELLHSGLLIHDDIMDRDELRRGAQAIYTQYTEVGKQNGTGDSRHFGVSMGINAADFCFFSGYELLGRLSNDIFGFVSHELTHVVAAQMQDVYASQIAQSLSENDVMTVYRYKTARYTFSLPLMVGAKLASASEAVIRMLDRIGENLGIIFQLRDDELNIIGNTQKTGKPQGSDVREHKQTLLSVYLTAEYPEKKLELLSFQELNNLYVKSGTRIRIAKKMLDLASTISQEVDELPIDSSHKSTFQALADFVQTREN